MRNLICFFLYGAGAIAVSGTLGYHTLAADEPNPNLDVPAYQAAVSAARPFLAEHTAQWVGQTAPGSAVSPARDAEQTWTAMEGWVKIPVGGDAGDTIARVPLPDPWPRGKRAYQCAWYILQPNFGPDLPETLWLRFDAVAHQCELFVNGEHVGHHLGGYTPFSFDITRSVHSGTNTIALWVRDEHAAEALGGKAAVSQVGVTYWGRKNLISPAGICGGAYFDARPAVHADHVLIRTSTRKNQIEVTSWLAAPAPAGASVTQSVYAWPDGTSPVLRLPGATIHPGESSTTVTTPWANAKRWSPEHPNLYVLRTTVADGTQSETIETRFGFREFWTEGKSFMLNGAPIRLRGVSVAHDVDLTLAGNPGVGRLYARDVFAFDKREFNYSAMRLHAGIHPPEAIQAADEIGFLCIDQSSIWSAMGGYYSAGADELLKNTRPQFTEWFWRDANSPSVVIWDVENEMIRGAGARNPERERWVLALDRFIKDLDPTRIVEHSGAAWYSPTQETIHVHMQQEYNHVLSDWSAHGHAPLIIGEFWVGGSAGETRLTDGHEYASRRDYYQDEAGIYREKILEMRYYGASGVMPFWMDDVILGRTKDGLWRSYDPKKDQIFLWRYPGLKNIGAEALSPVVAFAWPRDTSAIEGRTFEKEIVVCNDLEEAQVFTVSCNYAGKQEQWQTALGAAAQDRHKVAFQRAESGPLTVTISDASGRRWQGDTLNVHAIAPILESAPKLARQLVVMPAPSGPLAAKLRGLGLSFRLSTELPADPSHTLVVVLPGAAPDALGRTSDSLRKYLAAGGRVLVLDQSEAPIWLPLGLPFRSASDKSAPEFNLLGWPEYARYRRFSRDIALYAPNHPVFSGLTPNDFSWWNDEDGRVADDVYARPGATGMHAGAPYRVLAGASRREQASVIETRVGEGTAVLCQARALGESSNPAARVFLMNLLRYLDGPAWQLTETRVAFAGKVTATRLGSLVDLPTGAFVEATLSPSTPQIVLAGDGADVGLLDTLARSGRTVIVLSRETSNRLPGYATARAAGALYAGTRAGAIDEPHFWGVSSGSFLPLDESSAHGAFSRIPPDARVLLGGLTNAGYRRIGKGNLPPIEALDSTGPVAVEENRGRGKWIATTIEPWNPSIESDRQLLATLLTNAGVRVRSSDSGLGGVLAKLTVPVRIDGQLGDWTNDLEDRNISPYQHAEPIALTSRDRASGFSRNDQELSAVLYLLHDANNLYLAGIVFSLGPPLRVEFELNHRNVIIDFVNRFMSIDDGAVSGGHVALGSAIAHEIFDTRLLTVEPTTSGTTFEASIPWKTLGFSGPPATLSGIFRARRTGTVLQIPTAPEGVPLEPMPIRIER